MMRMAGGLSALASNPQQVVLIAPLASRRVIAFQHSLKQINWPPAKLISYFDIVDSPETLIKTIQPNTIVRLETSGECCATERLLLSLGQQSIASGRALAKATDLQLEMGEILPTNQWYTGLSHFFTLVQAQLKQSSQHYCTIDFDEALQLFDKRQTANIWQQAELTTPKQINEPVECFEHLLTVLNQERLGRVFIKLAHGSGASGAMALAINKGNILAITTIEVVETKQGSRFYNSRKLHRYTTWQQIARIIDYLLKFHHLQIESWIPKASYQGKVFDIRVVVIDNQPMHTLVRLGKQAITNLHLGNGRGDLDAIKNYLGDHWRLVPEIAAQAMHCFPKSLYAGVDILISQNSKKPYLLEANAFGDFHPNSYYQGLDTYQAELDALQAIKKVEMSR